MEHKPDKPVTLIDKGKPDKAGPNKQTAVIKHHDTVLDILKRFGHPTDGSVVMLKPGTRDAFDGEAKPYEEIENHAKVHIAPNTPKHVGKPVPEEPVPAGEEK